MKNNRFAFLLVLLFLPSCATTWKRSRTIDETEKAKYAVSQVAERVTETPPIQVQTTAPDGTRTDINLPPTSQSNYSLKDNTSTSSDSSITETISWQTGVPWMLSAALLFAVIIVGLKATASGRVIDRAGAFVIQKLSNSNDPSEREDWLQIRNLLERGGLR